MAALDSCGRPASAVEIRGPASRGAGGPSVHWLLYINPPEETPDVGAQSATEVLPELPQAVLQLQITLRPPVATETEVHH